MMLIIQTDGHAGKSNLAAHTEAILFPFLYSQYQPKPLPCYTNVNHSGKEYTMTDDTRTVDTIYKGWGGFQQTLVEAIEPLTDEHLTFKAAPHLQSVGKLAAHIAATRVRWFQMGLGVESEAARPIAEWGRDVEEPTTAAGLVDGLKQTWEMVRDALAGWTVDDLDKEVETVLRGQTYAIKRQWVIWHVLEHDLHHGGELLLTLGIHHLPTPFVGGPTEDVRLKEE